MSSALGVDREAIRSEEIVSVRSNATTRCPDTLAVEEPLEIRLAGCSVTVTMRTPGHDLDLAIGFLFTEGIIAGMSDVASLGHCATDDPESEGNIVNINPADHAGLDLARFQRNFLTTSSCGICGKATIESVKALHPPIDRDVRIAKGILLRMPNKLRAAQSVFQVTGGVHAAALFDLNGELILVREDVGRHNAVDKVIGAMVRQGRVPLNDHILFVSSRASFEIVQKALAARIPVVATVSAASSLAVDLARSSGIVLAGFVRNNEGNGKLFNVYSGADQIVGHNRSKLNAPGSVARPSVAARASTRPKT